MYFDSWRNRMASLADLITDFFSGLKTNTKGQTNTNELPPTYVVRTNSIVPNSNPSLAAIQPKIERDLVKVGELPTMSVLEDNKVSQNENIKDAAGEGDYISAYASKYGVTDNAIAKTIYNVANKFGESPELMFKIANHESAGFNPNAINPNTKAAGLFQFLPSTWKDVQDRLGGKALGLKDPLNPEQNAKAAALYIQDIKKQLSKVKSGDQITDQDIYLGHFSGAGRATKVLEALKQGKGNKPANTVYKSHEIENNKPVFYHGTFKTVKGKRVFVPNKLKTVQEVYDTIANNVNKEDTKDISFYLPNNAVKEV